MSIDEALAREDVRIHDYGPHGNVHKEVSFDFGDVEEGFAEADHVREDTFFFEGNTHLPLEQHAAVGVAGAGRQADALVLDPDPALRAPRAGQGPRDAAPRTSASSPVPTAAASAARATPSATRSWWRSSR